MRRHMLTALASAALMVAAAVPAAAAMGQGPGHNLPNVPGVNVLAHADTAAYSLAFTAHTSKSGTAHGSIDFRADGVILTNLDLHRLALVTAEAAAANGCNHGAMWIARGTALFNGTEPVKVWIDLQDRADGDLARIRAMAVKDHDGHDDGGDDHGGMPGGPGGTPGGGHEDGTDGHTDGHDDGHDDGHTGCGGGSPWLYRSHWFDVRDVAVHFKGYMKN